MQLSREQIERWAKSVGGNVFGGNAGGVGGGSNVDLGSYATKAWVENDYVSKAFFNELFVINGLQKVETSTDGGTTWTLVGQDTAITFAPNEVPSVTTEENPTTHVLTRTTRTITDIKVLAGLWSESYLSALGQNSSGGGGGGGSTALYGLTDVKPNSDTTPTMVFGLAGTSADNGKVLTYSTTYNKFIAAALPVDVNAVNALGVSGDYVTWTKNNTVNNLTVPYAGYTKVLRSSTMTADDDYETISAYTAQRGSFIAVNLGQISTLPNIGVYDTLVSLGYDYRTFQFKSSAYYRNLAYRTIVTDTSGGTTTYKFCDWRQIAFTDSNVASATKLATSRTLWGQSFDGSANVSGSMSGVGDIDMTGLFELWESSSRTHDFCIQWTSDVLTMYAYEGRYWDMCIGRHPTSVQLGGLYLDGANGRWGIATSTPYTGLDVNGGVKASKFYLYKPNSGNDTGAVYLEYDYSKNGVHLVGAGLYSDTYLSALGVDSSGSGAAVTLNDLLDVTDTFSGLAGGQALVYDAVSGKWTNGEAGVNMSTVWSALLADTNEQINASHLSMALSDYLPRTGGKMSGTLIISDAGAQVLVLNNDQGAATWVGIQFKKNGTQLASIGFNEQNGSLYRFTSSYTQYKIWDAGNDGTGSGLDADLLDGVHASGLFTTLANSGKNISVTIGGTNKTLEVGYAKNAIIPYSGDVGSDETYGNVNNMGTNGIALVRNYSNINKWQNTPSGFGYGSVITFFSGTLSNGLSGQLAWDVNHNVTSNVTKSLWWRANNSGGWQYADWHQIAFTDGNIATATKLATSRTLWGQSFDGSANVSGSMSGVGGIDMTGIFELWESSSRTHDFCIQWTSDVLTMYAYEGRFWDMCIGRHPTSVQLGGLYLDAANGRWGIATSTPYTRLDVNGGIKCTELWIGNIHITYDSTNGGLVIGGGLAITTYLSALGVNSGGGGGGTTLTEPLSSINTASLGTPTSGVKRYILWNGSAWTYGTPQLSVLTDVVISSPSDGQALVYNGTSGKWENQTIGGGSGTLKSIGLVMPTGFNVNPGTMTADGSFTVSFANGYSLPTNAKQNEWDNAYTFSQNTSFGIAGSDYIPIIIGGTTKNVLTDHQSLADYATQSWVNTQGFLKTATGTFWGQSWSNGGTVTGSLSSVGSITMSGDIQMANNTAVRMKPNGGDGQYWNVLTMNTGNTLALGYYTRTHGQTTDIQGGTITFAVNGGSGTASSAVDNRVDTMTIDENGRVWIKIASQGLRIGDGLITWDSQNNALKIQRISGSSVVEGGLYATSFLSALGANSGGGGSGVGDVTWTALADSNDTRAIAFSHFSNTLANAHVEVASLVISGECSIYDEGGDLVLTATNGDVYIEDDCTINGTTWISSTLGVNSLATFNSGAIIKYGGSTRFQFSSPASGHYLLTVSAAAAFSESVSATSFVNTSDERKKNVIDYDATLAVDDIANAPAIHFTWKDSADTSTHVGTLAQYWRDLCPEAVPENYDGFYGVDYAVLAMLSSISIARRIQELKQEIEQLKKAL